MREKLELTQIRPYVGRCIHDEGAPCSCACPYGLDIRSLMKKLTRGRISSAYKEFRTATVFPSVAAAFCDHPCEKQCQRALIGDEPLAVGKLEQAILHLSKPQPPDVFSIPAKEEKIAVIGAGPAGLSLALCMAQKKYPVTVFEKEDTWGGCLREQAEFPVFREDIAFQTSQETIEYRFGKEIRSLDELNAFSAIYIATGQGGADFGLGESWDPKYCTTSDTKVFMGGSVCGQSVTEGIACGRKISRYMEIVIQTGRMIPDAEGALCQTPSLVSKDALPAPVTVPADPAAGYSKEECKTEAARCFQCNCDKCMKGCELMAKYGKPPLQIGNEVEADLGPHFLAARTTTRQTYCCNQCGWCESICPEKIGMGNVFHTSRTERAVKGIQPEAFHDFWLRELDLVSGDAFYASSAREGKPYPYVFFPGCQAGASLPEQTVAAGEWLKKEFDAGVLLACCGASAWWAGAKERWEENTELLRKAWEDMGRPVFVTACATCADMLERFLPRIPQRSIYELLAEKAVPCRALLEEAALFDPCAARTNEPMQQGIRVIAERSGCRVEELSEKGRCCGWGGHIREADPVLYEQIVQNRAAQSELPYLVYCANCLDVFRKEGKTCRHILEFVFGPEEKQYTLQQKKENRLAVKDHFLQAYEGRRRTVMAREWDTMALQIDDAVRAEMERQLITDDDVKECIWKSGIDGARFVSEDGTYLASLAKQVITYWVEYREAPDGFEIVNAYCHRMKLVEQ